MLDLQLLTLLWAPHHPHELHWLIQSHQLNLPTPLGSPSCLHQHSEMH